MTDGSSAPAAEQRLGALAGALATCTLPACVRDAAGRYVAVNEAFSGLVGLEAARLVGKTDNALQPADVAHRVAELDALVLDAHGHLDAREVVLARDGRRTVRACRFPVYDAGEPWGIAVVMAPLEDAAAGAAARERLQSAAGMVTLPSGAPTAPLDELEAERSRTAAAEVEAQDAREALAVEREARLEAQVAARDAAEALAREQEAIEALREEAARLAEEREALAAAHAAADARHGELAAIADQAEEAERRLAEALAARDALAADLEAARERAAAAEHALHAAEGGDE
ncbi:MAG: PAS domain-containing protein, partial [Solirubrobacterales bacterium]|nr:PAS domain-containing protein [Solirubrobacterales bacterium]